MMKQQNQESDVAVSKLQEIFSLHHDQAHPDKVDAAIRANVRVSGTNMWVLIFAIAIASIGLNVNSTAVIIGAMLISPLMGPIVGMGYGVAVSDVKLIRLAIRNMLIFIVISLFTATLYFLITPLQQAQSELLARTQPTLWDVLIAFFGGSAGVVAITRKEVSNVVPGVAIATALMPPLCTAGYGLAHSNWDYFFGAFYLFAINCVFIAFATLVFAKLLKLPQRGLVTESRRLLHRIVIFIVILAVMLPSGYLATRLVQKELFTTTVTTVIKEVQQEEGFFVLRSTVDDKKKQVGLIINGMGNAEKITKTLIQKLSAAGIDAPQVKVLYAGGSEANLDLVKQELENNYSNSVQLQDQLKQQQDYINSLLAGNINSTEDSAVLKEIQAQYPEAEKIIIGRGLMWEKEVQTTNEISASTVMASEVTASAELVDGKNNENQVIAIWVQLPAPLSNKEYERLQAWLAQRFENSTIRLIVVTKNEHEE